MPGSRGASAPPGLGFAPFSAQRTASEAWKPPRRAARLLGAAAAMADAVGAPMAPLYRDELWGLVAVGAQNPSVVARSRLPQVLEGFQSSRTQFDAAGATLTNSG